MKLYLKIMWVCVIVDTICVIGLMLGYEWLLIPMVLTLIPTLIACGIGMADADNNKYK